MAFFEYTARFKIPVQTPLIKMETRKVLIIRWKDSNGETYFGECNAFETDWYHFETIETVKNDLSKWFEINKNKSFENYKIACESLTTLNDSPNARNTMSIIFFQKFHSLREVEVDYGATINGDIKQYFKSFDTLPNRVKLKWHDHIESDIEFLKEKHPNIDRAIDANGTLQKNDVKKLNQFKSERFIYVEQPFDKEEHYIISQLEVPVFIDEFATSLNAIKSYHEQYLIDGVVLKPSRIGGIDKTIEIIHFCKQNKIKIVIGGMYEFGLSSYFTAYLAQFSDYPSDITPSEYYFEDDFIQNLSKMKGTKIQFQPPFVNESKLSCL